MNISTFNLFWVYLRAKKKPSSGRSPHGAGTVGLTEVWGLVALLLLVSCGEGHGSKNILPSPSATYANICEFREKDEGSGARLRAIYMSDGKHGSVLSADEKCPGLAVLNRVLPGSWSGLETAEKRALGDYELRRFCVDASVTLAKVPEDLRKTGYGGNPNEKFVDAGQLHGFKAIEAAQMKQCLSGQLLN